MTWPIAPSSSHSFSRLHRLVGLALVAHLGDDLVLAGRLGDGAGLEHRVRQRLLAVDVLAGPHHGHRDRGVRVVRRGDDDGVDVLLLLEHLAEVEVELGLRVEPRWSSRRSRVSTSQRATMFSPAHALRLEAPIPPMPMAARFSLLLGASCPSTRLGTMAADSAAMRGRRRELPAGNGPGRVVAHAGVLRGHGQPHGHRVIMLHRLAVVLLCAPQVLDARARVRPQVLERKAMSGGSRDARRAGR